MDGPLPLGSNGIPYALDGFTVEGQVVGGDADDPYKMRLEPVEEPVHHQELPANWTVVTFPARAD